MLNKTILIYSCIGSQRRCSRIFGKVVENYDAKKIFLLPSQYSFKVRRWPAPVRLSNFRTKESNFGIFNDTPAHIFLDQKHTILV